MRDPFFRARNGSPSPEEFVWPVSGPIAQCVMGAGRRPSLGSCQCRLGGRGTTDRSDDARRVGTRKPPGRGKFKLWEAVVKRRRPEPARQRQVVSSAWHARLRSRVEERRFLVATPGLAGAGRSVCMAPRCQDPAAPSISAPGRSGHYEPHAERRCCRRRACQACCASIASRTSAPSDPWTRT